MEILEQLNPQQRKAARHIEGPLLILAGAGSGKTRVLTCRIAYLIQEKNVHPSQILAVTFTNKAAAEMRTRVDALLGESVQSHLITLSTFHALGARILRRHARRLQLTSGFTIYDDDDQRRLIRRLLLEDQQEADRREIRRLQGFIESMKNRGLTPAEAHESAYNQADEQDVFFYERYQKALRQANCVDFGDLLLGLLELFRDDPQLAKSYSEQWKFVMVDEFQDTNHAQFELLKHLTSTHKNLAVVGDDDQAIYRWRGATVANILDFSRTFPTATTVKLEQNYRSSDLILQAANDVIRHNPHRHDKTLWTDRTQGEPIICFTAASDREEAAFVADTILYKLAEGASFDDFAIFYRTNAQGRLFEEHLRQNGTPYQIVGGISFYAREEIKDLMAYLKVALNPGDEVALQRVLNTPTRGIGKTTLAKLTAAARVPGVGNLYRALRLAADDENHAQHDLFSPDRPRPRTLADEQALSAIANLGRAPRAGISHFLDLIAGIQDDLAHFPSLATVLQNFISRSGYLEYLETSDPESARDRTDNVAELISAITDFERDQQSNDATADEIDADSPIQPFLDANDSDALDQEDSLFADAPATLLLRQFLERSALIQSNDALQENGGAVTMMTVHGSKGLEFNTVFLVGMEDEMFPSLRDLSDPEELEEERRLAYVAITRAREQLYITNARRRRIHGTLKETYPSRFLLEIQPSRLTIDPRSTSKTIDFTESSYASSYAGSARRAFRQAPQPFEGGVNRALWDFDQSPEMIRGEIGRAVTRARAQPVVDEFSQVIPEWDTDFGDSDTIADAPADAMATWRTASAAKKGSTAKRDNAPQDLVGVTVTHTKFGIGTILSTSGEGDNARLVIDFPAGGKQTVIRRFVKILG